MKRPPRIFTEGDKRYILINGKKYYLKTKSNDKKLVSIVINNIMNKVKRRKRKGILQKKPSKLESSSSSSSSSTTPFNSFNKYQQLISDLKVEELRNEVKRLPGTMQKQINQSFAPTPQQLAITGVPPAPPLPGTNYTPQLTQLAGKLLTIENRLQNQATLTDLQNISRQLNTLQSDINNINKASKNITIDLQERDRLNKEVEDLKKLIPELTKAAEDEKKRIKEAEEAEKDRIKKEAERIKKENDEKIMQMQSEFDNKSENLKNQNQMLEKERNKSEEEKQKLIKEKVLPGFKYDNIISLNEINPEKDDIKIPYWNGKTARYIHYKYDKRGNIYPYKESYIQNKKKRESYENVNYENPYKLAKEEVNKILIPKLDIDTKTDEQKQPDSPPLGDKEEVQIPDAPKKKDDSNIIKQPETPLKASYKLLEDIRKKANQGFYEEDELNKSLEEELQGLNDDVLTAKLEKEIMAQLEEDDKKQKAEEEKKSKKKKGNKGHEEAEGDGLYDYELDDIMKGYKKHGYLGCFTLDEIKKINPENKKRISFFLNHDEHWMAVYLDASKDLSLEFMDPFASPPPSGFKEAMHQLINKMAPKLYLKYKINQIPQQNVKSDNCGAIAARFLMDRYAGKSFKEATNYTIEKSEKKAEALRGRYGYGLKPFTFI